MPDCRGIRYGTGFASQCPVRLAARALGDRDLPAAERYLRRAVAVDPLRESAHRALMQTLASGGSYAAALLVYRELRLLLHRELNAEPDPETRALFEQLRNVGTRITLDDFGLEEVAELNRRYDSPLRSEAEVERYAHRLGGQPYLTHRGLQAMARGKIDLTAFEAQADQDDGPFGDHLKRLLVLLLRAPELRAAVEEVLRGWPCRSADHFFRLRSAGVLAGPSARDARLRCPLYANYLERHLL